MSLAGTTDSGEGPLSNGIVISREGRFELISCSVRELEVCHSFLLLGHGVVESWGSGCTLVIAIDRKLKSVISEKEESTFWIGENVFGISSL